MYAIAVETSDLDGRPYKTRWWGAGTTVFLWFNEETAGNYLSDLDGNWFMGKIGERHEVRDAYTTEVGLDVIREFSMNGGVLFPWFSTWHFGDEGYDTPPEYEEEK